MYGTTDASYDFVVGSMQTAFRPLYAFCKAESLYEYRVFSQITPQRIRCSDQEPKAQLGKHKTRRFTVRGEIIETRAKVRISPLYLQPPPLIPKLEG
jgi:hypothetical protein